MASYSVYPISPNHAIYFLKFNVILLLVAEYMAPRDRMICESLTGEAKAVCVHAIMPYGGAEA
jgi:hypothetical protein